MKTSGLKMVLMVLFIIVMTGCSNDLSPNSDNADGKEPIVAPKDRTRVQRNVESPTGQGTVTDSGKIIAVYKYSGGVMVGLKERIGTCHFPEAVEQGSLPSKTPAVEKSVLTVIRITVGERTRW